MSVSTQTLLDKVESAISDLLDALAGDAVQEYTFQNRVYKRADFPGALNALMKTRDMLKQQLLQETAQPVRVVRLGRPRGVDR